MLCRVGQRSTALELQDSPGTAQPLTTSIWIMCTRNTLGGGITVQDLKIRGILLFELGVLN